MPESRTGRRAARAILAAPRGALRGALLPAIALAAFALSAPAYAQFKWVAADGSITYGDRPPPGARPLGQPAAATASPAGNAAALPYELRTAAQRHPVVLYLTADCPPCEQAREHLSRRGIPHEAREVRTARDAAAFRALGFSTLSFPAARIGSERLTGFEPSGWDRSLDAAGYPKESKLPRNWRFAQPEPLTVPEPAAVSLEAPGSANGANAADADAVATQAAVTPRRELPRRRADASAAGSAEPSIRF